MENNTVWTAGFFNERFPQPVSPLGWSIIAPLVEEVASRDPLSYLGCRDLPQWRILRLYNGHLYVNMAVFQTLYKVFPEGLLPEDAARYFPGGNTRLCRQAPYPCCLLDPRFLISALLAFLRDPGNWSPWHNYRKWEHFQLRHATAMAQIAAQIAGKSPVVVTAPVVPFQVPGPEIAMSLRLDQPRLNLGQAVQAHVTLTNTSPISDVNDLTLILESTDGVNFDAWPVSLAAGATQRVDYTFTPTTTGAYVLRAWLGIGLNMLAQQDAAYLVGSGPAIALNTSVSEVYSPGVTVTLPLTLTNVGDIAGTVTVTLQTVDRLRLGAAVFTTTVTANVSAGGMVVAEGIALPNASPGLYSVRLDLNGVAYDSRDFAVAATDTLFGLLTVGEVYPAVGQSVPVTATVRSADNTLTDAAITVTVSSPAGDVTTLPMARVMTGTYFAGYTPSVTGTYALDLAVAQAGYRGVGDQAFLVSGEPTLLVPTVEGWPRVGQIQPVTVTVRSLTGIPVSGATVVLSGTVELLRGDTDGLGQVVLQTFPSELQPYVLSAEKIGYAGAIVQVRVTFPEDIVPDCQVDITDIMQVASHWRCKCEDACYDPRYDLDGDCDIDIVDLMLVVKHWGETCG